jgi:glucosamine-6-phosphate deaminase
MADVRRFAGPDELGRVLAQELVEAPPRLLGCPGGRSLLSTYRALSGLGGLPETTVVMMDEYVPVPPLDVHYSCRGFAEREIPSPRIWLPDRTSDGHVAMLAPGAPRDGRTSVVELAETTRRDNLATFPEFASLDDVPARGVSVGLDTISAARALRLVVHGADKGAAVERLLSLDRFDPAWPVSIVHEHPDAQILVAP